MAKVRVHELAKELGQPSKVVLQKLQDMVLILKNTQQLLPKVVQASCMEL